MFDKHLIRKINSGRCFALVGSGPSCEAGYPSWKQLAQLTHKQLIADGRVTDPHSYNDYLAKASYPEFFRQAERDLGDNRDALVAILTPLLTPHHRNPSAIYDFITKWPFASYLTTNYDDELQIHLKKLNVDYSVVRNRLRDFHVWRDGSRGTIQKLHSDLDHPTELILTSADYRRLYVDAAGKYFRDALCRIFATFDVLIIGHSLSDPDLDYVLQLARQQRSPQHPVYMIAADFTRAHEREYFEKYNIVLVQYSNPDNSHSELTQMLRRADRFIVPRHRRPNRLILSRPQEETKAAIAVFLYRRLQGVQATDYLSPLILSGLDATESGEIDLKDLSSLPILNQIARNRPNYDEAINSSLDDLSGQGLVSLASDDVRLTSSGRLRVAELQNVRRAEADSAYREFRQALRTNHSPVQPSQLDECQKLAERIIVTSFSERGSMIANTIFPEESASPEELSDVFGCVTNHAAEIPDVALRAAFIDAVHAFLVEPSDQQKEYLTSVSQGYFLYHLLGLDPKCGEVRRDVFARTLWLCDSSIIVPRVAIGCNGHEYAVELFRLLIDEDAILCSTSLLLQEVWKHFRWAVDFMGQFGSDSIEVLRAALMQGSYRKNLFLEGYIRLCADGQVGSFEEYLRLILPNKGLSRSAFEQNVSGAGLRVLDIEKVDGFEQDDWRDLDETKAEIQREREDRSTYRSPLQVEAEAEVSVFLKNLRAEKYSVSGLKDARHFFFVSQSHVLDRLSRIEAVMTWTPEALYRYLSTLPGRQVDPELLQQCMLEDYFYAGISFIDKRRFAEFFRPSIDAAKASFEKEVDNYVRDVRDSHVGDIHEVFRRTEDLNKPFFSAQMGWQMAEAERRRAESVSQRLADSETRVRKLESERSKARKGESREKRRQRLARLRNLQSAKHVRKRRKQAKKRARKR